MTITQHKADVLFEKLVEAQAPIRPERLAEIQVAAEAGWELAGDYIHLARAWLGSQQALRDVIAENAALRARVYELEARLFSLTCKSCGNRLRSFYCPTCGKPMSRTVSTKETRDVADYDGEGIA